MRKILIFILLLLLTAFVAGKNANLTEMSVEEKIAQMFIVRGDIYYQEFVDMGIGGYFLDKYDNPDAYRKLIEKYNTSYIMPFFSTDMEGAWNPFSSFFDSKTFSEIKNKSDSYKLGKSHAKILKNMGFNLDFSPVVETKNEVWPDRSFQGNKTEVQDKISSYIKGLQENGIMACAKHYPGGSMIKDPHIFKVKVSEEYLEMDMFDRPIKENVSMIMIGHAIFSRKQSTISNELISELKAKYDGIIITDDITMRGLSISFIFNRRRMIRDLITSGNDIILWTGMTRFHHPTPQKVRRYIRYLSREVERGRIDEIEIDKSVEKILKAKGYKINH